MNMLLSYNNIFKGLLAQIGFTDKHSYAILETLNRDINLAITTKVYCALTPSESFQLAEEFDETEKLDAITVAKLLSNACRNSANHLNFDEIVKSTTYEVIEEFWNAILGKSTPEQREIIRSSLKQLVTQDKSLISVLNYFK
jgi:hypothetical protein